MVIQYKGMGMKQILRIASASILCLFLSSCEFFRAQDVAAQPNPVIKQNAEEPKKEAEAAPQGLVILGSGLITATR